MNDNTNGIGQLTESDAQLTSVREEIEVVHRFISAWFRGEELDTDDAYAAGLAGRLAPGFVNIQPAGKVLEREVLLDSLRKGHGANPDFRIEISDVEMRYADEGRGLLLANYVETQSGARHSSPPTNARISTVLFRRTDSGALEWLHLHETAVPVER